MPREDVADLLLLDRLDASEVLEALASRFRRGRIYTKLGPVLLAVNPYRQLPLYGKEARAKFEAHAKAGRPWAGAEPHVFAIVAAAFDAATRPVSASQSVVVSGESGAGKTEATKQMLAYLSAVAGSEGGTVTRRLLATNPILEAFGNARTLRNDNSSRFGKLFEVRLDAGTRAARGARLSTYLLEKARVTAHSPGERNYHVLYQLLAGASESERLVWGVGQRTPADFAYLQPGSGVAHEGDAERWEETRQALDDCGVSDDEQHELFLSLVGVFLLGNVAFRRRQHAHDDDEASEVAGEAAGATLSEAARLMGLDSAALAAALTSREIRAGAEVVRKPVPPAEASALRDALARTAYASLFDWLNARLNTAVAGAVGGSAAAAPNDAAAIRNLNLLDVFGFESFDVNTLDQLLINLANERLHSMFVKHIFESEENRAEYLDEGIPLDLITPPDNTRILALLEGMAPPGVFPLLDEDTKFPEATDASYTEKMGASLPKAGFGDIFQASGARFSVTHYAGKVTYESHGFLDRNRDTLHPGLRSLLALSTREPLMHNSLPTAPPPNTGRGRSKSFGSADKTLSSQFRMQMRQLQATLEAGGFNFVRCLKPNMNKSPQELDAELMASQLRYCGVVEAIQQLRQGFRVRMPYPALLSRVWALGRALPPPHRCYCPESPGPPADARGAATLVLQRHLARDSYALGKTKAFLRGDEMLGVLDHLHAQTLADAASCVVRMIKGRIIRRRFVRMRGAALRIQSAQRGALARRERARLERERAEELAVLREMSGAANDVDVGEEADLDDDDDDDDDDNEGVPSSADEVRRRMGEDGLGSVIVSTDATGERRRVGWLVKEGGTNKTWRWRFFVLSGGSLAYYKDESMQHFKGRVHLSHLLEPVSVSTIAKTRGALQRASAAWETAAARLNARMASLKHRVRGGSAAADPSAAEAVPPADDKRCDEQACILLKLHQRQFRIRCLSDVAYDTARAYLSEWATAINEEANSDGSKGVNRVLHEGYLAKMSGSRVRRTWRERYFVLTPGRLDYYDDVAPKRGAPKVQAFTPRVWRGGISLVGASCWRHEASPLVTVRHDQFIFQHYHRFVVSTRDHTIHLGSKSESGWREWITAINKAQHRLRGQTRPLLREGWLLREEPHSIRSGKSGTAKWRLVYCTLRVGRMDWFSKSMCRHRDFLGSCTLDPTNGGLVRMLARPDAPAEDAEEDEGEETKDAEADGPVEKKGRPGMLGKIGRRLSKMKSRFVEIRAAERSEPEGGDSEGKPADAKQRRGSWFSRLRQGSTSDEASPTQQSDVDSSGSWYEKGRSGVKNAARRASIGAAAAAKSASAAAQAAAVDARRRTSVLYHSVKEQMRTYEETLYADAEAASAASAAERSLVDWHAYHPNHRRYRFLFEMEVTSAVGGDDEDEDMDQSGGSAAAESEDASKELAGGGGTFATFSMEDTLGWVRTLDQALTLPGAAPVFVQHHGNALKFVPNAARMTAAQAVLFVMRLVGEDDGAAKSCVLGIVFRDGDDDTPQVLQERVRLATVVGGRRHWDTMAAHIIGGFTPPVSFVIAPRATAESEGWPRWTVTDAAEHRKDLSPYERATAEVVEMKRTGFSTTRPPPPPQLAPRKTSVALPDDAFAKEMKRRASNIETLVAPPKPKQKPPPPPPPRAEKKSIDDAFSNLSLSAAAADAVLGAGAAPQAEVAPPLEAAVAAPTPASVDGSITSGLSKAEKVKLALAKAGRK